MIELIVTAGITACSALLFAYWFRYTCLLILSAKTARDYAGEVAMANGLSFLTVQSQLREADANLDRLRGLLDRDFALVARMMTPDAMGQTGLENKMLAIHYKLASGFYQISRSFSPKMARQVLEEMSQVVAHYANSIGECAAGAAA